MENPFREHPKKALVLLAFPILIGILRLLDLLGGVWSFFSSIPPLQWLTERWPPMTAELYWWLMFLIHLCLLGVYFEICRQYRKIQKNDSRGISALRKTARTSTLNFPDLSPDQFLQLSHDIKRFHNLIKIKIVSSQEHLAVATTLVATFRAADYKFEIDDEGGKEIFLAKTKHDKFAIYYPHTDDPTRTEIYLVLSGCLVFSSICSPLHYQIGPFPKESTRTYLQIELGGAL
jgi:hypothetical protein